MSRYDDHDAPTRLYVGRLSTRTRSRDLEDLFSKYGRIREVDVKHDFAFVEFKDHRDADEARHYLDGKEFDGNRIVVEFARRGPRGSGGSREYLGRGPPPGTGRCYNCGDDGHWARDCKAGDRRDKCYRCGERGHKERNCRNSPVSSDRSPYRRSRSRSFSRSRSYSHSPRRYNRSPVREAKGRPRRSRSRSLTPSPVRRNGKSRSASPNPSTSESPETRESESPSSTGIQNGSPVKERSFTPDD
ncbi:hypothetical protein O6H91_13G026000 [Diphasiastrum complanatum]|uniref:Uncharacterized protein n=2 Tax=Diphasiastrum complanatum TaxID=34168 RepID=A0ACC2BT24_DIPCM|nr:hypothetical protein O6H91_Y337800 [Diphasiastrum complanatum]KAJ7284318.1 hypothetical protein O6H91_Y337800 [Diphasiastrum complanatum]KAJ7532930.1 hypothetical protein O6H91_13G026000 [Diphasiastrum complanatum]KAJ7532931.1 hypothetical protein O6H91_13G026000 [Diphasiastrum complanatum]